MGTIFGYDQEIKIEKKEFYTKAFLIYKYCLRYRCLYMYESMASEIVIQCLNNPLIDLSSDFLQKISFWLFELILLSILNHVIVNLFLEFVPVLDIWELR
jgi:hypothetical protein